MCAHACDDELLWGGGQHKSKGAQYGFLLVTVSGGVAPKRQNTLRVESLSPTHAHKRTLCMYDGAEVRQRQTETV